MKVTVSREGPQAPTPTDSPLKGPHLLWMPPFLFWAAACLVATVRQGQGEWALDPAAPLCLPGLLHLAAAPFRTLVSVLDRKGIYTPDLPGSGPPGSA